MAGTDWEAVASLARVQHSVVTRAQLGEQGITKTSLDWWIRHGRLESIQPGAFIVSGAERTWRQAVHAAVLAAGHGASASHRTSATLWGTLDDRSGVSIAVPRGRRPRLRGVTVHQLRDLTEDHISSVDRIRTINPMRTLVHLGATAPRWEVETALETGLVKKLFSYRAVEWMRHEMSRKGRHGVGILGEILDMRALAAARPESLLEPRMATFCRDRGLLMPDFQHVVRLRGKNYRIDFAYPDLKIAIEVDGFDPHGRREIWERDKTKRAALVDAGWLVIEVTWTDIVKKSAELAARIRRHLAERAAA